MTKEQQQYTLFEGLKELVTFKPLERKDMTPLLIMLFCQVFGVIVGTAFGVMNLKTMKPLMLAFTLFL